MKVMAASGGVAAGAQLEQQDHQAILPGLPDSHALRCLALVPRTEYAKLRGISTVWRALFDQRGLSSLHKMRRSLGLSENYLLLIPREHARAFSQSFVYHEVHVDPIDLTVTKKVLRTPPRRNEPTSLRGHACIAMGPFVLILGGAHFGPKALSSLYIFDTSATSWWPGASMQFPRSDFAWGVIGNRLYVAGGFADEDVGHIQQAEVYDLDSDQWSRLPDIPTQILIDLFFVHKGALYVRGVLCDSADYVLKLYSYKPLLNEWIDEDWMLTNVLKGLRPLTTNKITALQDKEDDTLFMLDIRREESVDYDLCPAQLKVLKLTPDTSEWNIEFEWPDIAHRSSGCPCTEAISRDVSFPSIGKEVVAMEHLEANNVCDYDYDFGYDDDNDEELTDDDDNNDKMNLQVTKCNEVLKLSVKCPARWDVVAVNA